MNGAIINLSKTFTLLMAISHAEIAMLRASHFLPTTGMVYEPFTSGKVLMNFNKGLIVPKNEYIILWPMMDFRWCRFQILAASEFVR